MAKVIMVQGTMSNVGKSVLTAGLCRVFKQDGYRVAPFKSQNMALNSFITDEGLEMGRAQVMQAEAAGIKPSVRMNPILLKPTTDVGSQVIVNGEVIGNMKASEYFRYKKKLIPNILKAYDSLAKEYDIIVIEGAGSPAEINLKQNDIVNMGLAKLLRAPVLLVGDIDRGGVFAQLLGTQMLLSEEEQTLLKAFVINKFRGDEKILQPGLDMLAKRANLLVAGVLPYASLDLDEEDSLSERFTKTLEKQAVDITIIKLPRISNFTDFAPLESEQGVSVRYVTRPEQIFETDLIILPGTKSTMQDLKWLRETGLEVAVKRAVQRGSYLIGICGGYQMLGDWLKDPECIEGRKIMRGMELLPLTTVFAKEKVRTRVKGIVLANSSEWGNLSGLPIQGYEIHMGRTKETVLSEDKTGQTIPYFSKMSAQDHQESYDGYVKNRIFGTYLHGLFDEPKFIQALLTLLFAKKGLLYEGYEGMNRAAYKEQQYDKLAKLVKNHLDMKLIYEIMEQGV